MISKYEDKTELLNVSFEFPLSRDLGNLPDTHDTSNANNFLLFAEKEPFGIFLDHPGKVTFDIGYTQQDTAVITMESWGDRWKPNQDWNHPWGAAPANIVIRQLCGIRPLAPGFTRFVIDPQPAGLQWLECRQPTPRGPIELRLDGDVLEWRAPAGTEAYYAGEVLPGGHGKQVRHLIRQAD